MKVLFVLLLLSYSLTSYAQSPQGTWVVNTIQQIEPLSADTVEKVLTAYSQVPESSEQDFCSSIHFGNNHRLVMIENGKTAKGKWTYENGLLTMKLRMRDANGKRKKLTRQFQVSDLSNDRMTLRVQADLYNVVLLHLHPTG